MSILSLPLAVPFDGHDGPRYRKKPRGFEPIVSPEALSFTWVDAWHPARAGLEAFISGVFLDSYGAKLSKFHDTLIGCADGQGQWVAALGLSALAHREAFLEQYLDKPVEQVIESVKSSTPGLRRVSRWDVAELGNLAAIRPGASRALILKMTQYLHRRHFRWVVFTATQGLVNSFAKLHYEPAVLASADPGRLHGDPHQWGTYYQHNPRVMVGDIHAAYEKFFASH